jgi:hypothetical protein
MAEWNAATKRLRKRYRALAALEPDLVKKLGTWTWRKRYATKWRWVVREVWREIWGLIRAKPAEGEVAGLRWTVRVMWGEVGGWRRMVRIASFLFVCIVSFLMISIVGGALVRSIYSFKGLSPSSTPPLKLRFQGGRFTVPDDTPAPPGISPQVWEKMKPEDKIRTKQFKKHFDNQVNEFLDRQKGRPGREDDGSRSRQQPIAPPSRDAPAVPAAGEGGAKQSRGTTERQPP